MKLFRVEIASDVYVTAETVRDAEDYVHRNVQSILADNGTYDFDVNGGSEVRSLEALPKDWHNSIAYGENDGDLTCEKILELASAPSEGGKP